MNRIVRHRREEVPFEIAHVRIDRTGMAGERSGLPLRRVTGDETIKILEPHTDGPLIERSGLARLIGRRIVILPEPRRAIPVLEQDASDSRAVPGDNAVVAR